jgi:hypothetical protein
MGSLAGGEQSATQPFAMLQLAKSPPDPDEELEEELELLELELLELELLELCEPELLELELLELELLELELLELPLVQLELLTTTSWAVNEVSESVE